eukprot:scaffold65898_cov22-Cyclotella_meneghiniana.AAC.2
MGDSTGAAAIFGASGGVLEAALRTAADALGLDAPIEYEQVRGVDRGIKVATIEGLGSVAAVSSIASAIELLSNDEWKKKFLMIEVMTCPGGCLGGGGEPKSDDKDILKKRMRGIYDIDASSKIRKSHENKEVQLLYDNMLVDVRDDEGAASLCTDNCVWNTNTDAFGAACGKDSIKALISDKLPPIQKNCGEEFKRHRLLSPSDGTDVIGPDGSKHHFDVVLDDRSGLIKSITRTTLSEENV